MISVISILSSRKLGDDVAARFVANVNGNVRTVYDIFTKEQWSLLSSGIPLNIVD